jgi:hypothetical protein
VDRGGNVLSEVICKYGGWCERRAEGVLDITQYTEFRVMKNQKPRPPRFVCGALQEDRDEPDARTGPLPNG